MNADDLLELLHKRYPYPRYAFFEQVRNAAGFAANRTADAMALGLWPSRGLALHGFELKIGRSDWLRELANPAKAEGISEFCDLFWLVVPNLDVARLQEVPEPWGLIVATKKGDKLRTERPATKLDARPLDRSFIAALLRRGYEAQPKRRALEAAFAHGEKVGSADHNNKVHLVESDLTSLRETVKRFEEASGVSVYREWRVGQIGEAVRCIIESGEAGAVHGARGQLMRLQSTAEGIVQDLNKRLESIGDR
jgi:hypothetical protein